MATDSEPITERRNVAIDRLLRAIRWLLGALILVSVFINFANVVARYLFLSPIFWAEPIITYIMIWCVFLGAALITWEGRHLNVDIFSSIAPAWFRTAAKVLAAVGLLLVAGLVTLQSFEVTEMIARNDQRTAVGELPLVVPHSALLVGFALMAIAALARIVLLVRGAARKGCELTDNRPASLAEPD